MPNTGDSATQTAGPPEPTDERLNCPLCDYDLRGLPENRCPECGRAFDPDELRRAKAERRLYFFEHAAIGLRARAFAVTSARSLLSLRFWREVNAGHAVEPTRLKQWAVGWAALTILGLAAAALLAVGMTFWRWSPVLNRADRSLGLAKTLELTAENEALFVGGASTLVALAWPLMAIAALSLFGQTLGRAGMHAGHQWRVVLYALPTAVLPPLVGTFVATIAPGDDKGERIFAIASFALTTTHFVLAHVLYLRLRHAAVQAILVQIVIVVTMLAAVALIRT